MNRIFAPETMLRIALWALLPMAVAHAAQDAPAAKGTSLQAIVMDVQGKARWRPSADAEWRDAKVNDIVDPGTEIRTGLKGRLTLRVGKNATVLVDSGTEFHIPDIVQDGETLRTLATVKSGRVDFKVDKVGFSNDFKVVTPATTLSVRGTGFSLATGPLQGVEVSGVRTNMINAIEVKYAASNATYFMSGAAQTSSERQDPVQSAWVSTVGPPPVVGTLADKGQLSQQVSQGQSGNAPTNTQSAQQVTGATANGQGGNSLILASQDPAASDAIRQLALDVTGNTAAVTAPTDPVYRVGDERLAEELAFVRKEAPGVLVDAAQLRSAASGIDVAATRLEDIYDGDALNTVARLATAYEEASRGKPEGSPNHPGTLVAGVVRAATDPDQQFVDGVRHAELAYGRALFSTADESVSAPEMFLRELDDNPGVRPALLRDGQGQAIETPRAVLWLENARSWSVSDLGQSDAFAAGILEGLQSGISETAVEGSLASMRNLVETWKVESSGRTVFDPVSGKTVVVPSPSLLALRINESVQGAWDRVVGSLLGNGARSAGGLQRDLSKDMGRLIDLMATRDFVSIHTGIDGYIEAYRAAAAAEGTAASADAVKQFIALVQPVQVAVDSSLKAAYDAARQASEARTLGQRTFLSAVSETNVRQAAEIARRCQEATLGQGGIIPNAAAMESGYIEARNAAALAGLVRADLSREGGGGRP